MESQRFNRAQVFLTESESQLSPHDTDSLNVILENAKQVFLDRVPYGEATEEQALALYAGWVKRYKLEQ